MSILNESTVEIKRTYNAPAAAVFNAIAEGVLFRTCGAKPETIKVDFREGGEWSVIFAPNIPHQGKFLQIERNKRIVFTWHNDGQVTLTLKEDKGATHLHLLHEGIPSLEKTKDIDWGWRDGLNDFTPEITRTIKIARELSGSVAQVYELFSKPEFFVRVGAQLETGSMDFRVGGKYFYKVTGCVDNDFVQGEFTDIRPNLCIVFTWNSRCAEGPTGETLVMIYFAKISDSKTMVTLTHAGFPSDGTAKEHEEGWTGIFDKLQSETNR